MQEKYRTWRDSETSSQIDLILSDDQSPSDADIAAVWYDSFLLSINILLVGVRLSVMAALRITARRVPLSTKCLATVESPLRAPRRYASTATATQTSNAAPHVQAQVKVVYSIVAYRNSQIIAHALYRRKQSSPIPTRRPTHPQSPSSKNARRSWCRPTFDRRM